MQWALYYPAARRGAICRRRRWRARARRASSGFAPAMPPARCKLSAACAADAWSRIGASMAYLDAGDTDRARQALADCERRRRRRGGRAPGAARRRRRSRPATSRRRAPRDRRRAAQNPTAAAPLVCCSSTSSCAQNRPEAARAAAERALAAHPQSVGALVAASEAAQSRFDLPAARVCSIARSRSTPATCTRSSTARASASAPTTPRAPGATPTARARSAAGRPAGPLAARVHPARRRADDGRAQPTSKPPRTRTRSSASRTSASGCPLPGGREDEGLLEMLTATLLEPKVSLYQSYLGKAYYQAQRFPEGLSALASAKRLDPRDPTPWLYASLYLRDQNQQVDALDELRPGDRAQRSPRRLSQPAAARSRPGDQERQPRGDLPAARVRGLGRVRSAQLARGRPHQRQRPPVPGRDLRRPARPHAGRWAASCSSTSSTRR